MKKALKFIGIGLLAVVVIFFLLPTPKDTPEETKKPAWGEKEATLVYDYDVEGPEDCTSLEKYDEAEEACYYSCADEASCKKIQDSIDKELDSWGSDYEAYSKGNKIDEAKAEATVNKEEANPKNTVYRVLPGEQIELKSGQDKEEYHDFWRLFARISPDELTDEYVSKYLLFSDPKDDTLAYVVFQDDDQKWELAINLASFKQDPPKERIFTLIHEFGHLLTLNDSQVDINASENSCPRYYDDGCSKPSSYINAFVNKFWTKDMLAAAKNAGEGDNGLAEKYPDSFITEYAASNASEDIAESFAGYVFGQDNDNDKNSEGVAGEKVAFFESYPELVNLRSDIRSAVGQMMQAAR